MASQSDQTRNVLSPTLVNSVDTSLLRNVFARKPLDKRREDGRLGIGHREPVHAWAGGPRGVESAYCAQRRHRRTRGFGPHEHVDCVFAVAVDESRNGVPFEIVESTVDMNETF